MQKISTRPATLADKETLLQFEQGVIQFERAFDVTLKKEKTHYYDIPLLIQSPDAQLLVAETNNQIIACGYARIEKAKHYLKHQQYAYLGMMYVLPEFRGQGINKKIMDGLITWSKERGITELRLEVYTQNESAISAYEKAGFTAHLLEMRMGL